MNPTAWRAAHEDTFFLDPTDKVGLEHWLRQASLIGPGETLMSISPAGNGNMNCTLRATTARQSFVVKQSRPWVERYPQFAAPWDRALRELEFYELIRERSAVASRMPRLLHVAAAARAFVLEDLGQLGDYTDVYRERMFTPSDVAILASWLSDLHGSFAHSSDRHDFANREMRALNHEHIFEIPLRPGNGLDLDRITPGLALEARRLQEDPSFMANLRRIAALYLEDGACLVHGDYFPGSFLRTVDGPRVIDPEFAHFGRAEFDVGVGLAHLLIARQPDNLIKSFLCGYKPGTSFDNGIMLQFAGAEIMRRLIGYAQLPLTINLGDKARLLAYARNMVVTPDRWQMSQAW